MNLVVVLQARGVLEIDIFPNQNAKQKYGRNKAYFSLGQIAKANIRLKYLLAGFIAALVLFVFAACAVRLSSTRIIAQSTLVAVRFVHTLAFSFSCVAVGLSVHMSTHMRGKSTKSQWLQQWQFKVSNLQHNKALRPTTYAPVVPPFAPAAGELGR